MAHLEVAYVSSIYLLLKFIYLGYEFADVFFSEHFLLIYLGES